MGHRFQWPDGKDFAFTVFDDTDRQTLANGRDVYAFLRDLGLRTTKSVWTGVGKRTADAWGATCDDPEYLRWVLELKAQGFEIALHNVNYHTSTRSETIRGIERFRDLFGHDPHALANHTGCRESIYWGNHRLTGVNETVYNLLLRNKHKGLFQGHIQDSPFFWGDVCRERIKYVRNFVFGDINTLKACPYMPYHDSKRPYVNYWFASTEGPEVNSFVSTLSERNQDRLGAEGGACIMYAHLAVGFYEGGRIHPRFKALMERLSKMNGWFVSVSALLDHLLEVKGRHELTDYERSRLERRWLLHKIRTRGTS